MARRYGIVFLVGAGPGDPGLITLRAIECLRQAEVVVHDRLANPILLSYAPQAEWVDVGKQPDHHPVPQEQINAILVEQARQGKMVVRLKGGDPFVFGRGGEEASSLVEAGIPFEIVPGISSAIAGPAYAGIPVTQRNVAGSVTFITGHRADREADSPSEWLRIAQGADTLVFLMGVQNLERIVESMMAAGKPGGTPVALIAQATTPAQETIVGSLETIVELGRAIHPPALIVIGEVAAMHQELRWFDIPARRPLFGKRILNTRPIIHLPNTPAGPDELSLKLLALGAEPVVLSTFSIDGVADLELVDRILERIKASGTRQPEYDWVIFTSANAVHFFLQRAVRLGIDGRSFARMKLAAVGKATAAGLNQYNLQPDFIPRRATGVDLAAGLGNVAGLRILLPRSASASADIITALHYAGAQVEAVSVYEQRPLQPEADVLERLLTGELDAALFFSPSALYHLADILSPRSLAEVLAPLTVAVVGPTTANAAVRLGVRIDLVAEEASVDGIAASLITHFAKSTEAR